MTQGRTMHCALVKEITLKGGNGILMMVCLDLICGNCGARHVANVTTLAEAKQEASWCPTCEDDQNPWAVMTNELVLALPGGPT